MLKAKTYTEIMLREIINDLLRHQTVEERYAEALIQIQAHLPQLDANNPKAFLSGLDLTPGLLSQTWKLITQSAERTLNRKLPEIEQPAAEVTYPTLTEINKARATEEPVSKVLPKPER